jgi:tetratricopeptide (TPR) repeat protein
MARRAEPSRPLLAGRTGRQATARFAFRELPLVRMGTERVQVLELIGPTDFDHRARSLHDRRGRFFGREDELQALEQALDRAIDLQTLQCVAVVGQTGVGKSRLIAEFVARADARRPAPQSVAVAATPEAADAPFSLVGDVLQAALNLLPGRGESARAKLGRRLRLALETARLPAEEIDEIIDTVDKALALRDGARLSSVSPPSHLLERVIAVLRRLKGLSSLRQPRLLILEDLHYGDSASRAALTGLLAPPHRPAADVILISARSRADLPERHVCTVIELSELRDEDAEALLLDRLGDEQTEVSIVLERAGGNPLFIEELAKVSAAETGEETNLSSLKEVIQARMDRLSRDAKAVLQYAAVLGPLFRRRVIDEVAPVDVGPALAELLEAGLVDPVEGFGSYGGEGEYQFRHGLIRDVVYESLNPAARKETHSRIGQLLATRYAAGRDEPPAVVAKHLEQGGLTRLAGDYWQAAGSSALRASFAESAVLSFGNAISLYQQAPKAEKELIQALLNRASARLLLGDHDGVGADLDALVRRPLDSKTRVEVARLLAERALRLGDFDAARAAAEQAEAVADQIGDEVGRGDAVRIRAEAFERLGKYQRAADEARRAIELFEAADKPDKVAQAQLGLGRVYLMQARYRQAQEAYQPVLEHLQRWDDPWAERLAKNHAAVIGLCMGRFGQAWAAANESLAICDRYGDRARAGDNHSVLGIILSEVGQFEDATKSFNRALAIQGRTGSKWAQADCLIYAGLNDYRSGRGPAGRMRIEEGLKLARSIGARYIEANALCALTETLLSGEGLADLGRALDAAVAATEIARESGLMSAEILAQSRLAQATAQTGDLAQAVVQSARAMSALRAQEFIEGPEEEVYFADYQMRQLAGMRGADESLSLAIATVRRKLESMRHHPDWQRSFRALARTGAILSESI